MRVWWLCVIAIVVAVVGGCGQTDESFTYHWDGERILCSKPIDDWIDTPQYDGVIAAARETSSVALLHTHTPGVTISWRELIDILDLGLPFVTYPELIRTVEPRAAIALAFDDDAVDDWYSMRQLLTARHVRLTFFVTRYRHYTDEQRDKLAQLAADGHAIEAHGVEHIPIDVYSASDMAYVMFEALPSIQALRDDGYDVTTFAYPGGHDREQADELLLRRVHRLRVGPRTCPN